MESEMSAEAIALLTPEPSRGWIRDKIDAAIRQAEERGYQRGKAGEWEEEAIILRRLLDEECKKTADLMRQIPTNTPERPLSPEQRTCMEREGLTVEEITSDWANLKMEGEGLRSRLSDRALVWRRAARTLEVMKENAEFEGSEIDLQILIALIYDKERNCTMEAERLRTEHLTSLEPLCDTPEGTARLYAEHGHITAQTVIERSAQRKMRQESPMGDGYAARTREHILEQVEREFNDSEPEDEGKNVSGYGG